MNPNNSNYQEYGGRYNDTVENNDGFVLNQNNDIMITGIRGWVTYYNVIGLEIFYNNQSFGNRIGYYPESSELIEYSLFRGEEIQDISGRFQQYINILIFHTTMDRYLQIGYNYDGYEFNLFIPQQVVSKIKWGFGDAIHFIGAEFKMLNNSNANINNQILYLYSKLNNQEITSSRLDDKSKMNEWINTVQKGQYLIATPNPYYHYFDKTKGNEKSSHYSKINISNIKFFALGGFDENLLSSGFDDYNPVLLNLIKDRKFITIHKLSILFNKKFVFGIKVKYKIVNKKKYKHTIIRSHVGKEYQRQKHFAVKKSHHFENDEQITRMYGTSGLVIESLLFETSLGKKFGGGENKKEGKEFNFSLSNNQYAFAFGGKIGDYLDFLYGYYYSL